MFLSVPFLTSCDRQKLNLVHAEHSLRLRPQQGRSGPRMRCLQGCHLGRHHLERVVRPDGPDPCAEGQGRETGYLKDRSSYKREYGSWLWQYLVQAGDARITHQQERECKSSWIRIVSRQHLRW